MPLPQTDLDAGIAELEAQRTVGLACRDTWDKFGDAEGCGLCEGKYGGQR